MSINVLADDDNQDWRKAGSIEVKLKNLIKVIPSTSDIMIQIGERYKNLYWAAKQGKWEFAEYQLEEIESNIKTLKITRPKRTKTANIFLDSALEDMEEAIEKQNWAGFKSNFEKMRKQCVQCHVSNDHAFIIPAKTPSKGSSPVLD
jgi:hypothetical protein